MLSSKSDVTNQQIQLVQTYLQETIGIAVQAEPLAKQELARLPLFFRNGYVYQQVTLLGKHVLFAIAKSADVPTPDQLKKQEEQLQQALGAHIVFVFERLEAYQRKRLIQKKIPFLVPGKQLYMPFFFIDLNERQDEPGKAVTKLRPSSQCLLLYHLEVAPLAGIPFKEIAALLGYANMTISRAAKELAAAGLATITGAREKHLHLRDDRKALWQESQPLLQSPVKETVFVSRLPENQVLYKANETALAASTNLAAGRRQTFAIGEETYRQLKETAQLRDANNTDGEFALEIWTYDPGLLAQDTTVDPLSLYLSMMDAEDERVAMALEQLLEEKLW